MNLNPKKLPNPKYIPKPYEKMLFPGQRVQIDVKFVPSSCLVGKAKNQKFYHYTALDEYSSLGMSKPLKNIAATVLQYFLNI